VGLPWEIYRTANLTPKYPHTIDLYTKGGAAIGYAAEIGLVDQYGFGWVILTAGAKGVEAQLPLREAILATLLPVIEDVAREAAEGTSSLHLCVYLIMRSRSICIMLTDGQIAILEIGQHRSTTHLELSTWKLIADRVYDYMNSVVMGAICWQPSPLFGTLNL
jgi:hypothetical protein